MNPAARIILFASSALCFGALLLAAMAGLPPFGNYQGPYGDVINDRALPQRHTPQSVAAVTFDYRGFDTMAEEFIFFAAVAGVLLLMRPQKGEEDRPPQDEAADRRSPPSSDAVRAAGTGLFPFTLLLGIYIILHGHLTPGGGFQGGVVSASAFFFIYLSGEYSDLERFTPPATLDILEAAGASAFVLVGIAGLLFGAAFMENVFPLGEAGELFSAGALPLLNIAVGLEVSAGFLLVLSAFLRQALIVRERSTGGA
ncbi:MAG TPA: MnhB domain-containing protein [Dissulfurispiraceae bacterium]